MSYETFAYYYDSLMDEQFYEDYHNFIKQHASFKSVLELGCGTGEIAVRLAKEDTLVYATDLSKDMLEVSRLKAIEKDVDLFLGCVDMTDFSVDTTVDLVLCLCDSLNYIVELEKVKNTFVNCYASLEKTGTFIFDVDSIYKMDTILANYLEENDDEEFYFKWSVTQIESGKVEHHVQIIDKENKEFVDEIHVQKTYPVAVYLQLLKDVGFNNVQLYSDFGNYKENCERIIFVCKKEEG